MYTRKKHVAASIKSYLWRSSSQHSSRSQDSQASKIKVTHQRSAIDCEDTAPSSQCRLPEPRSRPSGLGMLLYRAPSSSWNRFRWPGVANSAQLGPSHGPLGGWLGERWSSARTDGHGNPRRDHRNSDCPGSGGERAATFGGLTSECTCCRSPQASDYRPPMSHACSERGYWDPLGWKAVGRWAATSYSMRSLAQKHARAKCRWLLRSLTHALRFVEPFLEEWKVWQFCSQFEESEYHQELEKLILLQIFYNCSIITIHVYKKVLGRPTFYTQIIERCRNETYKNEGKDKKRLQGKIGQGGRGKVSLLLFAAK